MTRSGQPLEAVEPDLVLVTGALPSTCQPQPRWRASIIDISYDGEGDPYASCSLATRDVVVTHE